MFNCSILTPVDTIKDFEASAVRLTGDREPNLDTNWDWSWGVFVDSSVEFNAESRSFVDPIAFLLSLHAELSFLFLIAPCPSWLKITGRDPLARTPSHLSNIIRTTRRSQPVDCASSRTGPRTHPDTARRGAPKEEDAVTERATERTRDPTPDTSRASMVTSRPDRKREARRALLTTSLKFLNETILFPRVRWKGCRAT
ncbi:uncharacterized protein LOC105427302 isoform X1 [Pogonomyrmex barbatus]|uniref:Uncharacterized protein LOC105427302 isoform X1 n=1 Tax=Pogonomyrmex barbatus TaxID=144034 RepID=A0A6I9W6M3_9HYME|nr:uncharacterized protein LOC105427302 isoform X1 [Pogonomyrmex barbatus]